MRMFMMIVRMFVVMVVMVPIAMVMIMMISMIKKFMVNIMEGFFKRFRCHFVLRKLVPRKYVAKNHFLQCTFFHGTHEILIRIQPVHQLFDVRLHIVNVLDDPIGHLTLNIFFSNL